MSVRRKNHEGAAEQPRRPYSAKEIAERARIVRRFDDGAEYEEPLTETVLATLRQWFALAPYDEAARERLDWVAKTLIRADFERQFRSEDGRDAGTMKRPAPGRDEILKTAKRSRALTAEALVTSIQEKTNLSRQYISRELRKAVLAAAKELDGLTGDRLVTSVQAKTGIPRPYIAWVLRK